jgi:hypothetical protein
MAIKVNDLLELRSLDEEEARLVSGGYWFPVGATRSVSASYSVLQIEGESTDDKHVKW